MKNKEHYVSTLEAAEILGLNRTQVFRLIKAGKIPAIQIGRNYAIKLSDLGVFPGEVSFEIRKEIEKTVHRVFREYPDTMRWLGRE